MAEIRHERFALPTGVELDVALGGDPASPPIIFLHGFPESHRTWRHQLPDLAEDHFVVAPDQRGFARSSKPPEVADYAPDKTVGDLIALADALGIGRFTLVGHDWGGAIAWMAALTRPDRVERLIIINAPHPYIFQKSLIKDAGQRAASQYIRAFRNPNLEKHLEAIGLEAFFDGTFAKHVDTAKVGDERAVYLDQWSQPGAMTAMLNWYRASSIVVPETGEDAEPPAFLSQPFPPLRMPVLVIWGLGDTALLPCQLDGLDALVPDLKIVKVDAGHFVPWENPEAVTKAIRAFLA
ncbi:alpha/beta fold hydrolase [Sphingomonas colocasiae]|uniref:Alpha/beta hydrolase n=1 Tax=Sphingomonas colocasiae TaxID=1848973 RepID=A0ABS7PNL0_9SPHN|nr:alpha/beta hydrolase [Sphingomonas colocasiae]MBY8822032.1 alpha/beta hydrolase [Sphingomonas colocasiae]